MLIFLWLLIFYQTHQLRVHKYAAAEQTYLVSQTPSLKKIYQCKDKCFNLNETFSYPMKYIRTVWTQSGTQRMYLVGHCFIDINQTEGVEEWIPWNEMGRKKITRTQQQYDVWSKFKQQCENSIGQIKEDLRIGLGLTKIHSQYQFYANGTFINTQLGKQDDLNDMWTKILLGI